MCLAACWALGVGFWVLSAKWPRFHHLALGWDLALSVKTFCVVVYDGYEACEVLNKKMNPFTIPFVQLKMGSAMAMDLGWMGPNYSISTACATSNFCILNAANHIVEGEAVRPDALWGSDGAIVAIGLGGFVACRALSQRNSDPTKASRPWDNTQGSRCKVPDEALSCVSPDDEHSRHF
ncbi:hypothetical protein Fmac_020166 [Flemingia macrophylla]|uniref:beta-ketoacyl-[acyl-carrier-protein] synthase I n=1 Tax=Flemingia macrophylla TaxID=520843 RepID=A0ABD1LT91_9FABA